MKKLFENILLLSISLLWILNFSSGIIATIWLLFSGGWQIVLLGFLLGIVMPWVYSLAFLLDILFVIPISKLVEKGKKNLATLLGFLLSLYNNFILGFWVAFVFNIMIQVDYHPLAVWLWGYATVMSPIGYMASKEGRDAGSGTTMGVLFCQISYLLLTFGYYIMGSETTGYNLVWLLLFAFSAFTAFIYHDATKSTQQEYINNEQDYSISEKIEEATIISSPERKNNYCTGCGEKLEQNSNFCTNCGKALKG